MKRECDDGLSAQCNVQISGPRLGTVLQHSWMCKYCVPLSLLTQDLLFTVQACSRFHTQLLFGKVRKANTRPLLQV